MPLGKYSKERAGRKRERNNRGNTKIRAKRKKEGPSWLWCFSSQQPLHVLSSSFLVLAEHLPAHGKYQFFFFLLCLGVLLLSWLNCHYLSPQVLSPYFYFLPVPERGISGCLDGCLSVGPGQPTTVTNLLNVIPTQKKQMANFVRVSKLHTRSLTVTLHMLVETITNIK